ncbi:GNAT family N-acetyltransferase [Rhizobium halophytocola]|uniref:GNAT superfamily N-acetyltransferase n=1 Tax=Rhizobium halophytocola TaxID=735519 RepID=A0ABS4DZI7_9HYPH|nr:GNAT family N-acetyltransferase [Rhizobium halophytocola]MBP1851102.1 GNAT superfamily N-acetyltransferase [Rhizobium halophytocola]
MDVGTIAIRILPEQDEVFLAETLAILTESAVALGRSFDGDDLRIRAADGEGRLIGGLFANTVQGWMFVKYLAVDKDARNLGIGAKLLAAAETEARRLGLAGVYLDTFSFQAPRFYARQGYREIGRLPSVAGAPERIWFAKPFETEE